jgi:hypothetical protein
MGLLQVVPANCFSKGEVRRLSLYRAPCTCLIAFRSHSSLFGVVIDDCQRKLYTRKLMPRL